MITGAKNSAEAWVDAQQESRLCAQKAKERLMRDSSEEEVGTDPTCCHVFLSGKCTFCGTIESPLPSCKGMGYFDKTINPSQSGNHPDISGQNPKDLAGSRKPPLDLIPPVAEVEMAMAMKHGADRYGAWNWREKKITVRNYIAAMRRHISQFASHEDYDESGVTHLGHVMATAAILLDAIAHDCVDDNRVPSNVSELMLKYTQMPQQGDEIE